jgi:RND family efflux transporter MFP subunit
MSRLSRAALPLVSLLVVASCALGQGSSGSSIDFERFRAMTPAERLRAVESRSGAGAVFQPVARGDVTATVIERGSLEAATAADVTCQVKARGKDGAPGATIKWVVEDGTIVKKGDRLVELDDAALRDELQTVRTRARAAQTAVAAAGEEIGRAKKAADVAVRLAAIEVELAEADLQEPPAGQARRVLELKVERAKLRLEQAKDAAKGRLAKAEADRQERGAAAETEAGRLRDLQAELAKCVLTAPIDGLAVYPVAPMNRFGPPPLVVAPGEPVKEGQKLMRVVNLDRMVVNTRVHEAQVSSLKTGQPVRVKVDAFPARELTGRVAQVAAVASQEDWARTDVKVYPVTIAIADGPPGLKPGMSAEVRIATGEKKGVLAVPARAVLGIGKGRYCFVNAGKELVEREVVTGATDGTNVEVIAGLREGDAVLADPFAVLTRPEPRKSGAKGPPG